MSAVTAILLSRSSNGAHRRPVPRRRPAADRAGMRPDILGRPVLPDPPHDGDRIYRLQEATAAWAADTLDQRRRDLIERSLAARALPEEQRISRADPADIAATWQFVAHIVERLEIGDRSYSVRRGVSPD